MINALLGLKSSMSVKFDKFGKRIPVTEINAEPNIILSIKGNKALLGLKKIKKAKKSDSINKMIGYRPRFIKEIIISNLLSGKSTEDKSSLSAKDQLTVSIFQPGDLVKITGITKGKGFAGGMKRWGFSGGPKTHGQSDRWRAPGSIGQATTPGRVFKGKKMAGHMGNVKNTIRNLEIVEVDQQRNLIVVKGSVPGAKNGLLIVQKTGIYSDLNHKYPVSGVGAQQLDHPDTIGNNNQSDQIAESTDKNQKTDDVELKNTSNQKT